MNTPPQSSFAIGDLCLFLPTRNSTVPVWAAFNVSFPHHFLSPTGVIAEQMKTREWIVARITSLAETIVDTKVSKKPTLPFGLLEAHADLFPIFIGFVYKPLRSQPRNQVLHARGRTLE